MSVHEHSIQAYHAELPRLSRRAAAILFWFREHGKATDREVMRGMGFTDMNAVRPRITELVAAGMLQEAGSTTCPVTKKTVRIVDIKRPAQGALFS